MIIEEADDEGRIGSHIKISYNKSIGKNESRRKTKKIIW